MKKVLLFVCGIYAIALFNCESEPVDGNSSTDSNVNLSSKNQNGLDGNSVYLSTNTAGVLGIFNLSNGLTNPTLKTLNVPYADADGIVYDNKRDAVYHVNRTDKRLMAFSNISDAINGDNLLPSAMSSDTDFTSGREATLYNNKVVVVDDVTPGRLVSYHVNANNISNYRQYNLGIELWGIQVVDKDLFAVEDESNLLAYYQNFHNAQSGDLSPTSKVAIEGLVRTHGISYDASSDIMVLTDIGAATSPTDGALVVITNFRSKFMAAGNGGTISLADQYRILGDMTQLGNPVDVVVSSSKGAIFVAERAQQKFLVYTIPTSNCNCAPIYSAAFAGASAITADFK